MVLMAGWATTRSPPSCTAAGTSSRSGEFPALDTLERQLLAFGRRYEQIAQPFE
jgi:hypothetical protein